jgi:hypothetical protein
MENFKTNISNIQKLSNGVYKFSIENDTYQLSLEFLYENISIAVQQDGTFQNYTANLTYNDLAKSSLYKITEKLEDIYTEMQECIGTSEVVLAKQEDDRYVLTFFSEFKKKILHASIDLKPSRPLEPDNIVSRLSDMVKQLYDENKHKDRIIAELKRKDDELETSLYDLKMQIQRMKKYLIDEIEFVSFEFNDKFIYKNQIAGTNDVKDLTDRTCTKGICAKFPGWILIELNKEWDFEEIEIGGFGGNANLWGATNGANATISTSKDKMDWISVGLVPPSYNNQIQRVKVTLSTAKYIKFSSNTYLGIGYLNIIKKFML